MKLLHAPMIVGAMLLASPAAAQSPAAPAGPSKSLMDYRRHMFDPPVRVLANRSMAAMFNTAPVAASGKASSLPVRQAALNFTYSHDGQTRPASDIVERTFTDALIIVKDGVIVHDGYYNRASASTHLNSYSMAKSLNAVMVGLALKEGLIGSVTDPVTRYLPELKGTGYDGTTIRDLMEMRSGVAWVENFFSPGNLSYDAHVSSWVQERARYTDTALKTKPEHKPGTFFRYNSMDAAVVGWVVERAAKMPVSRYLSERLWQPAGMEADGFYVIDGEPGVGREFTAGGFNAVARDYARLALLMLNNGRANGRSFFPDDFVRNLSRDITGPEEQPKGYGWAWWTVKGTNAVTGVGGEGQYMFFDPDTKTVIVKLSHGPVGPEADAVDAETLAFFKATAKWGGR